MKAKISAIAIILVIFFQFWPPRSGRSQTRDTALSVENQFLFKLRNEIIDSINAKSNRALDKISKLEIKTDCGKKVIVIHDTIYLPFWHSLFKAKKHEKRH